MPISKALEGKYKVNIKEGQSLVRRIAGIGVVDFSTITLKQADALYKSGVKILEKIKPERKTRKDSSKPKTK